jgi:broad specificity phosphatase PhoE
LISFQPFFAARVVDVEQTRVTLVRHLPTQWNLEGRLQGIQDIDVATGAPETMAIAEKVRQLLKPRSFGKIWTSELRRTRQTAELLGYTSTSVSAQLNELDFGPWEGRLAPDLGTHAGGAWLSDPSRLEFGETFEGFVARVRAFTQDLYESGSSSALIVGHGAWIRCFIALLDSNDARRMNQIVVDNGEMVERDLQSALSGTLN